MSSATITINTGQQITTQYNLEKLFLWGNRYENDNYVNNFSYSTITLLAGTVMGRVASTGVLIPSTALIPISKPRCKAMASFRF